MKKRHSIHVLLAAAALLLATAACTKDELADGDRLPEGQYPVEIARITLGVEGGEAQPWGAPQTRVSENAEGTGSMFDAGDNFSVQIDGDTRTGTYAVQDDGSIKAESPLYWSDSGEHTVTAWYPAGDGTIDLSDQSQNLAYLLSGTGTGDYQNPVALTFTHALAKVRVTPTGEVLGKVTSLQLYTYTQCTYENGKVKQGSQEGWIEMKQCKYNGTTCFEANVVPGCEITKLMANHDNKERLLSQSITPEAGEFYDITLDDPGYTITTDEQGKTIYHVLNEQGLKNIAKLVNEEGNSGINITLEDDITLTGEWTPIGIDYNHQYTGTFDGGNKTITGLAVTGSNEYAGLFGYIGSGGTVKNVNLKDVLIENNYTFGYVGGVAGCSYGTLEYCVVSGSVISKGVSSGAGGVVGYQNGGFLTGCSSSAIVKGVSTVGGVAGTTDRDATLTGCYATGDVTLESSGTTTSFAGGVVGSNVQSTLKACYSWGSVTGTGTGTLYVGGVTGTNDLGTLTACYHAKGTVNGPDGTTGGVTGRNYKMFKAPVITACYWGSNPDAGIGENQAGTTGGTEQVTDDDWKNAMDGMNNALKSANSEWRYGLNNEGLPELFVFQ